MKRFIFVVACLVIWGAGYAQQGCTQVATLTPEQFKQKMAAGAGSIVVLDVRTPEEWDKGHLLKARLMNFMRNDFATHADTLNRNKTYLLYCASGGRSYDAAELLCQKGIKAFSLSGGYRDLKALGVE